MAKAITSKEAALLIGKSENTARSLCRRGFIGAADLNNKNNTYRYSAYKIAAYLCVPVEVVEVDLEGIRGEADV